MNIVYELAVNGATAGTGTRGDVDFVVGLV
jgi:hypothetical protein